MSSPSRDFSIVITIAERDADLVSRTLPSWLRLGCPDVVLCVDSPASENLLKAIDDASRQDKSVRVIQIADNPSWKFRHAYTRREGFRGARSDRILTGDIDIVVNRNCLKAIELVGENNVGLVSLSKRRGAGTLGEPVRNLSKMAARVVRGRHFFTGLYALYRPFWLDTEDQELLRAMLHPHEKDQAAGDAAYLGEDVFLRDSMSRKHSVLYLQDVGGKDLRVSLEDRAPIQAKLAAGYYREGKPLWYVLAQSILYARGTLLGTYLDLVNANQGAGAIVEGYASALSMPVRLAAHRGLKAAGMAKQRRDNLTAQSDS